jgi:hypothetical protein
MENPACGPHAYDLGPQLHQGHQDDPCPGGERRGRDEGAGYEERRHEGEADGAEPVHENPVVEKHTGDDQADQIGREYRITGPTWARRTDPWIRSPSGPTRY